MLDEYCQSTGLDRKYAIKVLGGKRRQGRRRGDPPLREIYPESNVKVLKGVWMSAGQPCGERFSKAMLALWLGSWERRHGELADCED